MDEWINWMWSIHTMECHSGTKRDEVLTSATICMDL